MKNTKGLPVYVRAGLIGIHSRSEAWFQFWLAIAVSLALMPIFNVGGSLFWTLSYSAFVLVTANWYWSCIRWVDEHARWERG